MAAKAKKVAKKAGKKKSPKMSKSTPKTKTSKLKPSKAKVKKTTVVKKKPVAKKIVKTKKPSAKAPKKIVSKKLKPTKLKPSKVKAKTVAKKVISKKTPKLRVIETKPSKKREEMVPGSLVGLDILPYQERPNEEYMNDRQHEHFRHILLKWKDQLLQEMNRTVHHLQDEAINLPDPNDRASQEEEFSLELRARDRERKLIKKIEETLQKIDENDYGFCDSCGVEIGIRRLEARPTANLCIDCKTLDEIRERQMGG